MIPRIPFLAVLVLLFAAPAAQGQEAGDRPLPFEALPLSASSPLGGMAVSPTRLVLQAGGRGEAVTLYNSGDKPLTFRIEAVDLAQNEDGRFSSMPADAPPPAWSALAWLRHSPQQVTLGPRERQTVRVIARMPRDHQAGEWRSHLRISSIPLVEEPASETQAAVADPAADAPATLSVAVGLDYRITIPVLLRSGEIDTSVAITGGRMDLRGEAGTERRVMVVTLARLGPHSPYGTLVAYDAAGLEIARLRGLSVLPPLASRIVELPLDQDGEPAVLAFHEEHASGETGIRLAEFRLD